MKVEPVIQDTDLFEEAGYHVITQANLADLELVKGPTVIHEDVRMAWANTLGWRTSGVLGTCESHHKSLLYSNTPCMSKFLV